MKKRLSIVLVICMFMTYFSNMAFAQSTNWNSGAKVNFVPYTSQATYRMSPWFETNTQDLDLEAYENLSECALRWNVFAGILRTYQAHLKENGYTPLSSNGAVLTQFADASSLVPEAQEEAKIMVGLGMLSGSVADDGKLYMNMQNSIKRSEFAKILAVFYQKLNPIDAYRSYMEVNFNDVRGHWSEEYVRYCYERGLVDGRNDYSYAPEDFITKEEAIQVLLNMEDKHISDGIGIKNIAKAINETYYCTTRYDEELGNNSSPTISNANIPITPDAYSYTVGPGREISINIKYATNRRIQATAINENCVITGKRSNTGTMNLTVRGQFTGTSFIRCSYTDGSDYEDVYIPIFIKNSYSGNKITSIEVKDTNLALKAGETYFLGNNVITNGGNSFFNDYSQVTYREIYYASSNPKIASVNYMTGSIVARSRGNCYIYILADGATRKVRVAVSGNSTGIYPGFQDSGFGLYEYFGTLYPKQTLSLKNKIYNNTKYSLRYSSSDTTVATVSSTGLITAKKAGTTYITITCNNKKVVYTLTVERNGYYEDDYVRSISFDGQDSATIGVGETFDLDDIIEVYPYYADRDNLRYESSNTKVATVGSKNGRIKGVSGGNTIIEVSANGVSAYFRIYVDNNKISVTDILISNKNLELKLGQSYKLSDDVKVIPSNATEKTAIYTSSNSDVVFISTLTGEMLAEKEGTATITVEVGGIKEKVNVVVKGNGGGTDVTPSPSPTISPNPTPDVSPSPSPTVTPIPTNPPTSIPSKDEISFVINDIVDIAVDEHFNPYSVLAGDYSGVTFSFSNGSFARMEGKEVVGVTSSNNVVFYLIATNNKGKTAQLPMKVH